MAFIQEWHARRGAQIWLIEASVVEPSLRVYHGHLKKHKVYLNHNMQVSRIIFDRFQELGMSDLGDAETSDRQWIRTCVYGVCTCMQYRDKTPSSLGGRGGSRERRMQVIT
jgi:hypothetical protein